MPLPFFFGKPADVIHQQPFVFAHVRGGRKSLPLNQFVKGCFIGFKRGAYGLFVIMRLNKYTKICIIKINYVHLRIFTI
jgi:hypothetical protein